MKSVTIPTGVATAWSGTFRSFVDGDIFRESNIDLNAGDIAERLAYLKDKADAAAYLAADQTFTGSCTFAGGATKTFSVTGDNAASFAGVTVSSSFTTQAGSSVSIVADDCEIASPLLLSSALGVATGDLADAAATIGAAATIYRVPTLTANRIYTLPSAAVNNHTVLVVRMRTADAFTVTVQTSGATTMGVISASAAGWILCHYKTSAAAWRVVAWGGTVTSLDTGV